MANQKVESCLKKKKPPERKYSLTVVTVVPNWSKKADRNESFQQKFPYPIDDIDFLSSNLERCFTSNFFVKFGSLNLTNWLCSGLN